MNNELELEFIEQPVYKSFLEHLDDVIKENGWDNIDDAYYGLNLTPFLGLIDKAADLFEKQVKQQFT